MTSGTDWTSPVETNVEFLEPRPDYLSENINQETAKDYRYAAVNYVDTSRLSRNVYDVWVIRQSQSPEEMSADVVISYEGEENTLSTTVRKLASKNVINLPTLSLVFLTF